jgi:hypothetical protein
MMSLLEYIILLFVQCNNIFKVSSLDEDEDEDEDEDDAAAAAGDDNDDDDDQDTFGG